MTANYCIDNKVHLHNKPLIKDIHALEQLADDALAHSQDRFDLTSEAATKFRASILLIPLGLLKFGKVKFVGSG